MSASTQDTGVGMSGPTGGIQDRRPKPSGVLPRQVQMWLMVGIALVILLIILVTGHSEPAARPSAAVPAMAPALAATDRIRSYQQQLAADEARQRQILARQSAVERSTSAVP